MKSQKIQKLSANLANQIAAGEVVARPASVFKETVENSIDAGATRVEVIIEDGGLKLIEIRDNGFGIPKEELELAIKRHATSKIKSLEDLEKVASFGFRGEALAAISSVSRFELISCAQGQKSGWRLSFDPAICETKILEYPQVQGTRLIIKDLFFNTPARRKFLRTARTEFSHIEKSMRNFGLAFPQVNFKLKHNGKIVWDLLEQNLFDRCRKIMGDKFVQNSLAINSESEHWRLTGFVGLPQISKSTTDSQYFFVNNRPVTDRVVNHAVKQAYADISYGGKQAVFVLFLEISPDSVDVNVHPTKNEVRFRAQNQIHSFIYSSLHKELSRPLAGLKSASSFFEDSNSNSDAKDILNEEILSEYDLLENKKLSNPIFLAKNSQKPLLAGVQKNSTLVFNLQEIENSKNTENLNLFDNFKNFSKPENFDNSKSLENLEIRDLFDTKNQNANIQQDLTQEFSIPPMGFALAQVKNTFILAENAQGLLIVDMHAAHERIIYEELKVQLAQDKLSIQNLLFPLVLELEASLVETAEEKQEFLQNLGLDLEIKNDNKILLKSFPSLLQQENAVALVSEVLHDLHNFDSHLAWQANMERCLVSMSCQGAWRTGKKLNLHQMNYLLRSMEKTPNSDECCHGRLTWKQFSMSNLNSFFKRGQ